MRPDIAFRLIAVPLLIAMASCSEKAPTPEQLLARANESFAADQYGKAEKEYREVLRVAPNDPTALRQLAFIYSDQAQLIQAFPIVRRAAELQPNDSKIQSRLGLILLAFGDHLQAREAALKALETEPGDERTLMLLADTATNSKDITELENLIEGLRQKDQDRAGYHLALGALSFKRKDQARAEREFRAAIELNPKSDQAYGALGLLLWIQKDLKAAEVAFKTAADLSPARSPTRLLYADFKLRTGAASEARTFLEDINRKVPDALPPRVALMKMACADKRDDDCAKRVKDILSQDSTNFEAVLQNGILNLAKGDAPGAIRDFEYLSKVFRRNAQIRYQLALAYLLSTKGASETAARNAVETAESNLSEAVSLDPRLEQAVLLFSELKMRRGSAAAAIDPLLRLIKERPDIVRAYYLLATAYAAQRNTDQALSTYQKMTELFPKEAQPYFLIGTIRLSQRQASEARQAFEKATELDPNFLPAVEMLVDLDISEKQYDAAIARIQKRIDNDPKRGQLWALRGKVELARQNTSQAEADLIKATELDGNLTQAYVMLAQLYVVSKRQEEAIKKLNASIEIRKTVPALLLLAAIYEQGKNFSGARDAYEALLSVSSNFVPALNNLAVIYAERLGQLDKALDLAKRARELNSSDPSVADTLGWIFFRKGEYGQALPLLKETAEKMSGNPEVQFHLGMTHYMMGDEQGARDSLRRATESKVEFSGRTEAEARLALLAIDIATVNDTGVGAIKKYLNERPNDPIGLAKLAQIQERDGQIEQAIATYEKIIAAVPQFPSAIRRLALLYSERPADLSKAFEFATRARQAYPDDLDVTKLLGLLNFRRELYPRAIELLRQVVAKRTDDAELLYYLGDAHRRLKQWQECKQTLEAATGGKLPPSLVDQANSALTECTEALTAK